MKIKGLSDIKKNGATKRKTPFLLAFIYRAVLVAAASALLLSYLSIYVNPSKFALPLFFGLYYIPIVAVNIALLLISILRRSRAGWITIVILLPSILYAESFFKVGGGEKEPQTEGIRMKIESYNVGMFSVREKAERREKIMNHIRKEKPHIVCFQEFYVSSKRQIDTILQEYKYRYYHLFKIRNGDYFGNLIVSKLPIISSGKISFPKSTNLSIYVDIDHYGSKIRVYNNHLESYNVSFTGFLKNLYSSDYRSDEIRDEIVEVHEKMKGTFIKRTEQVDKILETIGNSHYPAIICGDFNDTPISYTYHKLSKGRKDSFRESGGGFAGTYAPVWPLLRIDYILFPSQFEGISHKTYRLDYSDHYPISAEIII